MRILCSFIAGSPTLTASLSSLRRTVLFKSEQCQVCGKLHACLAQTNRPCYQRGQPNLQSNYISKLSRILNQNAWREILLEILPTAGKGQFQKAVLDVLALMFDLNIVSKHHHYTQKRPQHFKMASQMPL